MIDPLINLIDAAHPLHSFILISKYEILGDKLET